jgi:hypothetical protein
MIPCDAPKKHNFACSGEAVAKLSSRSVKICGKRVNYTSGMTFLHV